MDTLMIEYKENNDDFEIVEKTARLYRKINFNLIACFAAFIKIIDLFTRFLKSYILPGSCISKFLNKYPMEKYNNKVPCIFGENINLMDYITNKSNSKLKFSWIQEWTQNEFYGFSYLEKSFFYSQIIWYLSLVSIILIIIGFLVQLVFIFTIISDFFSFNFKDNYMVSFSIIIYYLTGLTVFFLLFMGLEFLINSKFWFGFFYITFMLFGIFSCFILGKYMHDELYITEVPPYEYTAKKTTYMLYFYLFLILFYLLALYFSPKIKNREKYYYKIYKHYYYNDAHRYID